LIASGGDQFLPLMKAVERQRHGRFYDRPESIVDEDEPDATRFADSN